MIRHNRHVSLSFIVFLAITGSATLTLAQQQNISQLLSPCIDEHTLAVLKIDVTRIDVDAFYDMALKLMSQSESTAPSLGDVVDLQRIKEEPKQWQAKFTAAGGKTVYAVWNTANPLDLLVAVPVAPGVDGSNLSKEINKIYQIQNDDCIKQIRKDNLILVGTREALDRYNEIVPTVRPELQRAAATVGPGAIQLYLVPNIDTRRVIEALLPAVSEQRIVPETNAIVKGLQWATVSIGLPPHTSFKLHIESADSASASALRNTLIKGYEVVDQIPQLQRLGTPLQEALNTLTPTVEGNTLQLALDKDQCMDLVTHLLAPALVETDQIAERIACATNLSGMGKAILIYANDHDDKFPPNLQALVNTVEFPRKGLACPATRNNPDYNSYVYRGVDLKGVSAPPTLIVVHDRKGNHRDGRNVLYVDSHVEWIAERDFADAIRRDNEIRQKYNYKPKPAE